MRREALRVGGVEPGGGLVEQQHFGVGHARASDRHELTLALAELFGVPIAQLAQTGAFQRGGHVALAVLASGAERGRTDVFLDGQVVVELERLERAGQAPPHADMGRKLVDAIAV